MDENSKYGLGANPPYSLYQAENGKWGLVEGNGRKLEADFMRLSDETFSCCFWEVVTFSEQEGFEVQAWCDPCEEPWFSFTWDNPVYPEAYDAYLWQKCDRKLEEFPQLANVLPKPYLKAMLVNDKDDVNESDVYLRTLLSEYPEAEDFAATTAVIQSIMESDETSEDLKHALWRSKVSLDYDLLYYMDKKNRQFNK